MPVYAYRMINDMDTSLRALATQFFQKTPLVLSPDEFISAFIAPEHVLKLKEVQELVGASGTPSANTSAYASSGQACSLFIHFAGSSPVILPQYVRSGLQPTCPDELRGRITAWTDQRLEYGYAFGDTLDAISYLNEECGDLRAMSLMLPCIASIMANISEDGESTVVKRARKLSEQTRFGKLPSLPPEVKRRLAEISALVNATTLMKGAPLPALPRNAAAFQFSRGFVPARRSSMFYRDQPPGVAVPAATFV